MPDIKPGELMDNYAYQGGDPKNPKSWLEVGTVMDGHKFKGGVAKDQANWESTAPAPQESAVKRYARGALNVLPLAGGIIGATVANIPGAAFGAGLGAATKQLGEGLMGPEPIVKAPTVAGTIQALKEPAKEAFLAGTGEGIGQGVGMAAKRAISSPIGEKVLEVLGRGASKIGQTLTGVPQKEIQTYATRADQVKALIKKSGGDLSQAADDLRSNVLSKVMSTKQKLGGEIGEALSKAPTDQAIDVVPVIDKLQSVKARLNPNLKADAVSDLDEIINKVSKEAPEGKVSVQQLNEIKEYLQDQAKSSYAKGGQIFSRAKDAAHASKVAAREARLTIDSLVPEIKQANSQLSQLHGIEDVLNKSMIAPGKSESALMAVGAGTNPRNARLLKRLGELTNQDIVGGAEDLAAARRFSNIQIDPLDVNGKSLWRSGAGAGLGYTVGGYPGAVVGGALTSPMTLKTAIDLGNMGRAASQYLPFSPYGAAGQIFTKPSVWSQLLKDKDEK